MRTPRSLRVSRTLGVDDRTSSYRFRVRLWPETHELLMRKTAAGVLLVCVVWLLACSAVLAQLPQTRVYSVFPPGGQVGTTFDLTVTRGEDLEELSSLRFSHPGIQATAKTAPAASGKTELVPNQFTVSIAPDVPPGHYELYGRGLYGVSNPRRFTVGVLAELSETEPNNTREQAQLIEVDKTINGRVNGATDIDFFKFAGVAGQRLIIDAVAQRIDSRLDGTLEIQDTTGRRLAVARGNVAKDAVLDFTVPAAGEYTVRLSDFVYAGGEDYFYRLTLRTGPWIDYVSPPAGLPGSTAKYTLFGRNLPGGEATDLKIDGRPLQKLVVEITLPATSDLPPSNIVLGSSFAGVDGFTYSLPSPTGPSNSVIIGFAQSEVITEVETNHQPATAQKITVPAELSGHFQVRGDVDLYQFEAKAGQVFWMDVLGQRSGSGCDPYLILDQVIVNDKGEETLKRIAAIDDEGTNLFPIEFDTIHDDPVYKFAVPADGTYRVTLRDRFGSSRGSLAMQYRLTIRPEQPDYRLVAVTSGPQPAAVKNPQTWALGLRRGDQFPVKVLVLRRDGFAGEVTVSAEGLPAGVTCNEVTIGAQTSSGILVFTTTEDAPEWTGPVKIMGRSRLIDAATTAAVTTATAAVKPAEATVAAATAALAKATTDAEQAQKTLAAAQEALKAAPDDEALKKAVTDAEAAVATTKTALDAATAAKTAADQKLAEAQAAVAQATSAATAATKVFTHEARYGVIAWSGGVNIPGRPRLSSTLELSIIAEPAPFQVKTDLQMVQANHSRQFFIPVNVIRRNGFEADVGLTFVGQPANVQVENKPVKKGTTSEHYRVFVPANAAVGTYVLHLAAQAPVSYRRNPAKAELRKAEFAEADKAAVAAVEAQKAAVAKRDEAAKLAAELVEAVKKGAETKAAAEKALLEAQAAEKAAAEAVTAAGEDAAVKAEAEKKLAAAQAVVKTATEAVTAAEKARVDGEAKSKAAEEARVAAENGVKQADEAVKATAARKVAAENLSKEAEKVSAPKDINFLPTTTPIILRIQPSPFTLTTAPANGGMVKRGAKLEVKVTIKRQNEFAGPVTLAIDVPPGITGLQAAPVVVPADQSEGTLVIEAGAEATEGALANVMVRASGAYQGEALVDQPVAITVAK